MVEVPEPTSLNVWGVAGGTLGVLLLTTIGYHVFEKEVGNIGARGDNWKWHAAYWAVALVVILLLPAVVSVYVFSNLTLTAVGVALPIYESLRAVCTVEEGDDKMWLQYWMLGGVVFMLTTWVDDMIQSQTVTEYWYETMVFFFYWLYFPKTQGATMMYERVTKPYLAPLLQPALMKLDNAISYVYHVMVNAVHLWFLWLFFLFLPKGFKHMVAIFVGTVYPTLSSVSAAATEEIEDDTYWLTYWSVYGVLFMIMEILDTYIGWVPGFYSLMIFTTVYLMLPMFQGADKVFRNILVPLAGLKELLLLRDAIHVKKEMFRNLPPERAKSVRRAIAKFYEEDDDTADPIKLKQELYAEWSGLTLSNPFASSGKKEATETTSLV